MLILVYTVHCHVSFLMSQIKLCDTILNSISYSVHSLRICILLECSVQIFFFLILLKDVKVLECPLALYCVPSFHVCVNLPYLSVFVPLE